MRRQRYSANTADSDSDPEPRKRGGLVGKGEKTGAASDKQTDTLLKQTVADIWVYVLSHPRKIFLLALAGVLVLWIVFGNYGVVARLRMEAENRMLKAHQEQEEMRIIENTGKIRSAHDPETIERIAREKYNFSRDNETLFIIEDK